MQFLEDAAPRFVVERPETSRLSCREPQTGHLQKLRLDSTQQIGVKSRPWGVVHHVHSTSKSCRAGQHDPPDVQSVRPSDAFGFGRISFDSDRASGSSAGNPQQRFSRTHREGVA